MERRSRGSSVGKSSLVDLTINTINNYFTNSGDLEETKTLIINNTLPNELRSIAWRIFLNILPNNCEPIDWVKSTDSYRAEYEKKLSNSELTDIKQIIVNKNNTITGDLGNIYKQLQLRLEELQSHLEFFKSIIVGETLNRLFFVWYVNDSTKDDNQELIIKAYDILAGLIFALFPCIVPSQNDPISIKSKEDATPRALYYYLNSEDYFDADVYTIFNDLMNKKGIKNLISSKKEREDWNKTLQGVLEGNLKELSDELEKIAYIYLKESNESLLKHLSESKIDPYVSVKGLKTSLLTSSIKYEQVIYLWDIIFAYSDKNTINFINYLSVALVNNTNPQMKTEGFSPEKHRIIEFSAKDIVKKAMKLKEKLEE